MGLALQVGYLAEMLGDAPDDSEEFLQEYVRLNEVLKKHGLPPHNEPTVAGKDGVFSCDMWGYSGLHYLRRLAAHLDMKGALPAPGGDRAADDPVIEEYCDLANAPPACLLSRMLGKSGKERHFDHLIIHSDAEGYYLPRDFSAVLVVDPGENIPGGIIGSSPRLRAECLRLAAALELPPDLDHEAEEVWQAADSQGTGKGGWQRYGIESYVCLRLLRATECSIRSGAAVVFC